MADEARILVDKRNFQGTLLTEVLSVTTRPGRQRVVLGAPAGSDGPGHFMWPLPGTGMLRPEAGSLGPWGSHCGGAAWAAPRLSGGTAGVNGPPQSSRPRMPAPEPMWRSALAAPRPGPRSPMGHIDHDASAGLLVAATHDSMMMCLDATVTGRVTRKAACLTLRAGRCNFRRACACGICLSNHRFH
jgi:hypothetical protein